jgi:hypothetical protein
MTVTQSDGSRIKQIVSVGANHLASVAARTACREAEILDTNCAAELMIRLVRERVGSLKRSELIAALAAWPLPNAFSVYCYMRESGQPQKSSAETLDDLARWSGPGAANERPTMKILVSKKMRALRAEINLKPVTSDLDGDALFDEAGVPREAFLLSHFAALELFRRGAAVVCLGLRRPWQQGRGSARNHHNPPSPHAQMFVPPVA